ncbi:S8 family serine peptidase [Lentzea jiangxiensis]|uniref:Subtilase family protein n=1 Tax=Lentzea jiangxiensis TaxID=641025 RepID=A0A1H0F9E8_9PSEU|nr:S8 family serine peptidase [Lentzea jiangxiensis]SDN91220.1 Subtilase family protein [Lentzea jiangxiensis]
MKNWRRRTGTVLLTAVLGTTGIGFAATPAIAQNAPQEQPAADKQLDKKDRELVDQAAREGKPTVDLLVAAEDGKTDAAVAELKALGATVQKTEKDVDYVKVTIPRDNAEKAAKLASVSTVDVDGLIALDDPRPQGMEQPAPQKAPDAKTPRTNPYMPTQDTQAAQFATAHPKWDGRGTTIAVIDSGIDLDTPALQTTSTGERKIIDWYNANATNSGDGTWVSMTKTGVTGKFTNGGREWTAPATGGPYSFGLFRETAGDLNLSNSETGGDINRDGDRVDSFGVIQDITTKEVFVDTDGDGNFTNNKRMIDYKVKQDVGFFGTDNPATPVVDRVAFVVQTDRSVYDNAGTPYVNLGISGAAHGTHVAGITAAHKMFDGKMAGAAPGAKLIAIKACLSTPSCTSSGLIDGVLYAARNGADVVNISIGGLPALNDGNNARAELYNRTIDEYNVQLFISAGNSGAGANTVGDPSVATNAVSVGSYITKETWLSNYGSKTAQKQNLHGFSSRGPAEDGGFKPNIVAPGSAISTTPRWQPGGPVTGTYTLPAGYSQFNGTSMAAPQATGAAALLVSAYKATHNGQRPTSAELRYAIQRSASFVSTLGAYEQGAGLFNTNAAWSLLDKHSTPDKVTTAVPVNTVLSGLLATPGVGVGIHDREGVTAGQEYTRTYTLTRTTGHDDETYNVSWKGNDGTFTAAKKVRLPLNTPVLFPVKVKAKTAGVHSAVLQLDNPETPGVDVQTLNAVFAAENFNAANKFSVTKTGTIARNQSTSLFVNVPAGTSALKVDMAAGGAEAGKGQVRFLRFTPQGVPLDVTSSTNCYNPDAGAGCAGGTPTSRTVANPMAGVWEIVVEARRTSDADVAPYTVTASVLGTSVSPNPDVIPSAALGTPVERTYTVTNTQAVFTGRLAAGAVGSAKQDRPTIANLETKFYDIQVAPGSSSLTATIGNTADQAADLDLFLLNCTSGTCVVAGQSADADSEESATVTNPAAGLWRVQVDGYAVPAGTTAYDYFDIYTSAALGALTVSDTNADRAAGASWNAKGVITPLGQPGAGRVLRGELEVRTADENVVGRGAVIIQAVS